jgi:hypothetical protein
MKVSRIQYIITLSALIVIIMHLKWPTLAIDGITLALIAIAIIPWLAPLFKSVELPGGWKIEFQELQKAKSDADKAGLLAPTNSVEILPRYSFETIADDDPNLALAGLRIEIEKRLQNIAEARNIPIRKQSVGSLMRTLSQENAITKQEYSVLADMIGMLNSAVHGASVDKRGVEWALETGPRLLKSLDDITSRQH